MDATTLIAERLEAYAERLREAMADIDDADLMVQTGPHDNPMGWLLWHMTRFEDRTFAFIGETEQLWTQEGWHERFGLPPDPAADGVGDTMGQVLALRVEKAALTGYFEAVRQRTLACLARLEPEDLDREKPDFAGEGDIRIGIALGRYLADHLAHAGQIHYLRGHVAGWGRYPR